MKFCRFDHPSATATITGNATVGLTWMKHLFGDEWTRLDLELPGMDVIGYFLLERSSKKWRLLHAWHSCGAFLVFAHHVFQLGKWTNDNEIALAEHFDGDDDHHHHPPHHHHHQLGLIRVYARVYPENCATTTLWWLYLTLARNYFNSFNHSKTSNSETSWLPLKRLLGNKSSLKKPKLNFVAQKLSNQYRMMPSRGRNLSDPNLDSLWLLSFLQGF